MIQEKVKIPSGKNRLAAVVERDEKVKSEKLAILLPGYLDTKDYTHLVKLAGELVKQGYTTVRFDPTGTWESEGNISEYTTTQYLADIKAVVEFMLNRGSYKKIIIGGHSRGARLAVMYAARDTKISAVISIMPSLQSVMDEKLKEAEKSGFTIHNRDIPGDSGTKTFKVPYSHILDNYKYRVDEDVKRVKVPVLFLAGELDKICPPEDVKKVYNNANEPKEYIVIKNIGHDFRHNFSEIDAVNGVIIDFIKKNNL
ncbi:MAG: alpha/beta hydrolase [Candidatus Colwellbacteria bacterium]|nr:alpha/beta hydrolase [Candidatus Colwellbacteria bacterium]